MPGGRDMIQEVERAFDRERAQERGYAIEDEEQ